MNNKLDSFLYYGHGGSGNRGCEAIVKASLKILQKHDIQNRVVLSTLDKKADLEAGLSLDEYISNRFLKHNSLEVYLAAVFSKFFDKPEIAARIMYKNLLNHLRKPKAHALFFSIGGDNYCCENPAWLYMINKKIDAYGGKRILWGCSVEPDTIDHRMKNDLMKYCLITTRESITYKALHDKGIANDMCSIKLYPDPAFLLEKECSSMGVSTGNIVGINISPVITTLEGRDQITFRNFRKLIDHIISYSDCSVVLVPHVIIQGNSDYEVMLPLYKEFCHTGRISILDGSYNASEIKGFISRCRFFVGARTHATIAAYSTCVPTLVVGYSVKARGIARDIFGSEENMVIPVQSLEHEDDLVNAFKYIQENEDSIRQHLQDFMPSYIERAWQAGEEVKKLLEK